MRILLRLILLSGLLGLLGASAVGGWIWFGIMPTLPSIEHLKDIRLQVPLRVYTRQGLLIAEFGEKRRVPLKMAEMPEKMTQAVLAAEDDRFYEHPGVDWQGILRAVLHIIKTGEKGPGGSTVTMQVTRNIFLGSEKTYIRKLKEILLSLKIERSLEKDEILELYLNKIFLGHRAYGVGAAAQVYYGKTIDDLTLAQYAMIAGLPKAPSKYNPVVNPSRAIERRKYVLDRMRQLAMIEEADYQAALKAPVTARVHGLHTEVSAPYVAEMVRGHLEAMVGDQAYTGGYRVTTTINGSFQEAANKALRDALVAYDTRHGYRGAELQVPFDGQSGPGEWDLILKDIPTVGGLAPAIVTDVAEKSATAYARGIGEVDLVWAGIAWARKQISETRRGRKPKTAADVLAAGDIVRILRRTPETDGKKKPAEKPEDPGWRITQIPEIEGALVSLSPKDGAILALAGGFDFFHNKFNRAVQARRQPGSNFKPFIYSAALEHGFTPATLINDAPVVFDDPSLEAAWRPENYSGKFFGPTRLREGLIRSRNLISIRILRTMGPEFIHKYLPRFGLNVQDLPTNLSLALGSGVLAPIEIATGYASFANGGYRVEPYFVERIVNASGATVDAADPLVVCTQCDAAGPDDEPINAADLLDTEPTTDPAEPTSDAAETGKARPPRIALRTLDPRNAWLMTSMLKDVIRFGTGRKARVLKRKDIGGKTGTTNDQHDAWFSGFNPDVVTTTWVGFDKLKPLGSRETGGRAALPMWIDYMRVALAAFPERSLEQPPGLVTMRIDKQTGEPTAAGNPRAMFETFRSERAPRPMEGASETDIAKGGALDGGSAEDVTEKLF